jgi:hypothetical protein
VALIGGGPSLTPEHVVTVREAGLRCIAINNAYMVAPFAEVCYFADARWWEKHKDEVDFRFFPGQKCSIQDSMDAIKDDSVHFLRNKHFPNLGVGLSLNPREIVTGHHGGFQALNIAILAGATRILLLGFDGKAGANGRTHWHSGHGRAVPDAAYQEYRKSFSAAETAIIEAGVTVINCSPGSEINSFPKIALEDALAHETA